MSLVLNGTNQHVYKPISSINYREDLWAQFAWVKLAPEEAAGWLFGISRSTSFQRVSGAMLRDNSGPTISSVMNGGAGYAFIGVTAVSEGVWIPVLRTKNTTGNVASYDYTINVAGVSTTAAAGGAPSEPDRITLGATYNSGNAVDFFSGKIAHWAEWQGSLPSAAAISELMAGVAPNELSETLPDDYEALISGLGSFTGVGSPTFDSDDPLVSAPSINPTGTTTSAAPGGSFTVNLSNMDGRTVASLELYDPASGVSTAQSYTGTTSLTGTVTLGNLPYRDGMEWVVTLDNAAELTAEFEMVPAAGRSLTEIEADFDETDQSIGYGFDPALEVGSQLEYATDTLTVYPDALFYTDYEGSQVVNHWSPSTKQWYQETIITGDLPSEVNDMFKLPTMAIPAMKIPTMRIP